jgi:hypothetical protein
VTHSTHVTHPTHSTHVAHPTHPTHSTHPTHVTHPTYKAYLGSADAQNGRGSAFCFGQIWFSVSPSYSSPFFIT